MKQTKRMLAVLLCVAALAITTSCSQKSSSGCPNWGKVKNESTIKKSV